MTLARTVLVIHVSVMQVWAQRGKTKSEPLPTATEMGTYDIVLISREKLGYEFDTGRYHRPGEGPYVDRYVATLWSRQPCVFTLTLPHI